MHSLSGAKLKYPLFFSARGVSQPIGIDVRSINDGFLAIIRILVMTLYNVIQR